MKVKIRQKLPVLEAEALEATDTNNEDGTITLQQKPNSG
jgi:hypothetical protein